MPKKPKFLIDIITKKAYELPADGTQYLVGRSPDCKIRTLSPTTDSKDYSDIEKLVAKSVSREQFKIMQTPDGRVIILPANRERPSARMWLGTEKDAIKYPIGSRQEEIPVGAYITIGNGYQFVLRNYKEEEPKINKEIEGRVRDTAEIKIPIRSLNEK